MYVEPTRSINTRPVGFEPFVQGFLTEEEEGWGHPGRLAGLAQARDGSLLLSDDTNGILYRIAYTGAGQAGTGPGAPTNGGGLCIGVKGAVGVQPPNPTPSQLTTEIIEAEDTIAVRSPAFEDGSAIPDLYADEGQNISPPLTWDEGPAGTMSYALIMEDPDVGQDPPFVHWILYNIPAEVTRLDEAVPGAPRLVRPEGALQGGNERGAFGYFGPRPPEEDPVHHYHFQVFALDTMLDLPHGARRADFLGPIRGRVLAGGAVVGMYKR